MNIIANNVASKALVAFVAAAMLFTLATPAKAVTVEELQSQIAALLAQINSLQGGSSSGSCASIPAPLTVGSQGADVTALQNFLIGQGQSIPAGATGYFGAQTQAALAAWQAANGVSPAAGYYGPITKAAVDAKCVPTSGGDDTANDDDDTANDDDDDSSGDLSGEASLDSVEISDGDDADDVEEGSEDVQVAEIDVEFSDGDAMITRMDIVLVATDDGNDDVDPWDVFDEVSLWVDGDEVAREDASDEDNYLDEDDGSIRFSGLDIVGMEDEEVTVTVAVSTQSSVDGSDDGADWDVAVSAIRYVDADDVTTTDESTGDIDGTSPFTEATAEFSVDEAGAGDDLDLETSDEDPDSQTLELDEDTNTEYEIFAFDLSADDSDGDIEINEIVVAVGVSSSTLNTFVNDFRLEIDGQSFDPESYTNTATASITFDIDGEVTVAADETVTAVLFADFENMDDLGNEGTTITATTSAAVIDAEGAGSGEDVTVDGGTVSGETHTLRTEGVVVEFVDDTVSEIENNDTSTTDDQAHFILEFTVESFGDDIYLPFGASSTTDLTAGVEYSIINTNTNAVVNTGTHIASLDMDEDGETNSFLVGDSDTQTFTLDVKFDPTADGSYKLRLDAINWATTDAATATESQDVSGEDIDTAQISITG